ncbi:MAG: hypothetical protein WC071_10230 [Victivallaceae bacterium]
MKLTITLSVLLCIAGGVLITYANSLPVYTDEDAPARISRELENLPRAERFSQWYLKLKSYETPHKRLSDLGRGLLTSGLGMLIAIIMLRAYYKCAWMRRELILLAIWLSLWGMKIPLTVWYYALRQNRFDYPMWGDSIGIPIAGECIFWIICGIISSLILLLLSLGRQLPCNCKISKPGSFLEWIRSLFIFLWMILTIISMYEGLIYGDEGMAFTCPIFGAILFLFLTSEKSNKTIESTIKPPADSCETTNGLI